jgi:hypothetical protein
LNNVACSLQGPVVMSWLFYATGGRCKAYARVKSRNDWPRVRAVNHYTLARYSPNIHKREFPTTTSDAQLETVLSKFATRKKRR